MLLGIIKMLSIQWLYFTRFCSYSTKYMQHPFVTGEQVECHPVFCTSVTVSTVELNPITCYSFVYPFYKSNLSTIRKILEPLLCEVLQTMRACNLCNWSFFPEFVSLDSIFYDVYMFFDMIALTLFPCFQ